MSALIHVAYDADEDVSVSLFTPAGLWFKPGDGSVNVYADGDLASYHIDGTPLGVVGLGAKIYVHTVPTPDTLPAQFNWVAIDNNTGDVITTGFISLDADGNEITPNKLAAGAITDASFDFEDEVEGPATGFVSRMNQLWRRWMKRHAKAGGVLTTYADDNTTPLTEQVLTTNVNGSQQTVGPANVPA